MFRIFHRALCNRNRFSIPSALPCSHASTAGGDFQTQSRADTGIVSLVTVVQSGKLSQSLLLLREILESNSSQGDGSFTGLVSTAFVNESAASVPLTTAIVNLVKRSAGPYQLTGFRDILTKHFLLIPKPTSEAVTHTSTARDSSVTPNVFVLGSEDLSAIILRAIQVGSTDEALAWFRLGIQNQYQYQRTQTHINRATFEALVLLVAKRRDWTDLFLLLGELREVMIGDEQGDVPDASRGSSSSDGKKDASIRRNIFAELVKSCMQYPFVRWVHAERFYWDAAPDQRTEKMAVNVLRTLAAVSATTQAVNYIKKLGITLPLEGGRPGTTISVALYEEAAISLVAGGEWDEFSCLSRRFLGIRGNTRDVSPSALTAKIPLVSESIRLLLPELTASIDMDINSREKLFVAAAAAVAADLLRGSDSTSPESLFTALLAYNKDSGAARDDKSIAGATASAVQLLGRFSDELSYSSSSLTSMSKIASNLAAAYSPVATSSPFVPVSAPVFNDLRLPVASTSPTTDSNYLLVHQVQSALVCLMVNSGHLTEALSAFRALDSSGGNFIDRRGAAFPKLLRALSSADMHDEVLEVYEKLLRRRDAALQTSVSNRKKDGTFLNRRALAPIEPAAFAPVLHSLRARKQLAAMCTLLLQDAPKRCAHIPLFCYTILLKAHRDAGMHDKTVSLFTEIWSRIIQGGTRSTGTKENRVRAKIQKEEMRRKHITFNADLEAMVLTTLESCSAVSWLGEDALRVVMMSEKLSQQLATRETTDQKAFYLSCYKLLAKSLATPENVSILPQLLSTLMTNKELSLLPSRSLLQVCWQLCRDEDQKESEERIMNLERQLGYRI